MPAENLPARRAWTLPATVTTLGDLADALGLQPRFGDGAFTQPALDSTAELALGFTTDGDVRQLAANVLAQLEAEA